MYLCYIRASKWRTAEHDSSLESTERIKSTCELGLVGGGSARAHKPVGDLEAKAPERRLVVDTPGGSTFPPKDGLCFSLLSRQMLWAGSTVLITCRGLFFARLTLGGGGVLSVYPFNTWSTQGENLMKFTRALVSRAQTALQLHIDSRLDDPTLYKSHR